LAVAVHTALEECRLVINHFNNGKSLIEIAEIIKRSRSALQHIVERCKKLNRLTNKVRKSGKKNFYNV
jgi:predicted DNA-binding protein YlxM (UPF0122 family)